jgi:outer membrane receptor protein involved in Fe transport
MPKLFFAKKSMAISTSRGAVVMGNISLAAAYAAKFSKLRLRTVLFATVAVISARTVQAQAADQNSAQPAKQNAADQTKIEEIVVTSLKHSSSVQKTPITVSAVTGQSLVNAGIQDISKLKQSVPGLTFVDAGPSNTRVVIRGVQSVGEPTVGVYYDEAPVTGSVSASNDSGGSTPLLKLFDVERVEVLRGPQGTLYGAGSMAGTLRVIYNKPDFNYEGSVQASVDSVKGGEVGYDLEGMVNLPLIDDKLAARLVLFNTDAGGYVDDPALHEKNVNTTRTSGGRFMLRFEPTNNLTIDSAIFYQTSNSQVPLWNLGAGKYNSTSSTQLPDADRLTVYSLTARWDLGSVIATADASYMDRHWNQVTAAGDITAFLAKDMNNPAACARFAGGGAPCSSTTAASFNSYVQNLLPNTLYPRQHTTAPTFEFRLNSSGPQAIDWTAGAFYSNRISAVSNLEQIADASTGAFIPNDFVYDREIKDQLIQAAVYGEATWHAADNLSLTAGTRYFTYDRHVGGATPVALNLVGSVVTPYQQVSSSENGWVSKFNASYQFDPDLLFYAQASQGFRPGGANQVVGLPTALTPYGSDSLWDYEAGVKTSWFDDRLTANLDGYLIDWSDMQVAGKTPDGTFSFISNAGAARTQGIELELDAQPASGLTLQANAALSSSKLTEDQVSASVFAPGVKGDRIPYAPNFTAGASAQYLWPIGQDLDGFARLDLNYVGASYSEFSPANLYYRKLPAYTLVNARIGLEEGENGWGVYLYVNNVFDKLAINYATASALTISETLVTSAPPRTIGLTVSKSF